MKQSPSALALTVCLLALLAIPAKANVITSDPVAVGSDGQLLELNSTDNVVMHIPITADATGDTLNSIEIINDSWGMGSPADNTDLTAVRLWYVADDTMGELNTTTAVHVADLAYNSARSAPAWNNPALALTVSNNSALYVTVDISPSAFVTNECAFTSRASWLSFQGGGNFPASELPSPPAVHVISSYYPAEPLNVTYTKKGQLNLSTGQAFTPLTLSLENSGTVNTAPIWLQGITVTVKDPDNATLAPDRAIEKIGVFGMSSVGPVYSEITALPSSPASVYIPFSTTVTVSSTIDLDIFVTVSSNTATVVSSFYLEISSGSSFKSVDAISRRSILTQAGSTAVFPFRSNLFTIRYAVTGVNVYHTSILTANNSVLKGQTGVMPLGLTFINPGNTNTVHAAISQLSIAVYDGSNNPVVPGTIFSRMAITNQGVIHGEQTTLPTSGNLITIPLSNSFISVPVYQPVTATVMVDILPAATATEFKLTVSSASNITAQDGNSQLIIPAAALYGSDQFPMSTDIIPIATSFNLAATSLAPATIYPNQQREIIELTFTHPGPANVGNLQLSGITVTAKNEHDEPIAVDQDIVSVYIRNAGNQVLGLASTGTTSSLYINFSTPLQIAPFTTVDLTLELIAQNDFTTKLMKLAIDSNQAIAVTQPSDPSRSVFVAGLWPLESTVMSLGGGQGKLYLSNYPNPFAAGYEETTIAYFLEQSSTVTIRLFTLQGDEVKTLVNNSYRAAGEQTVTWRGLTTSGTPVKNGVYLLHIESVPVSSGNKVIQQRKIAVVK